MMRFYNEELLATHSTPKLEDHTLLAVHDCLFNMTAILHIGGHSSICNLRTGHAVVRGAHLCDMGQYQNIIKRRTPTVNSAHYGVRR